MFVVIFSQSAVISGVIRLAGERIESLPLSLLWNVKVTQDMSNLSYEIPIYEWKKTRSPE